MNFACIANFTSPQAKLQARFDVPLAPFPLFLSIFPIFPHFAPCYNTYMKFQTVKKGYDPKAVDQYISVKSEEHRDQLDTAKQRAALLVEENDALRREVEGLRRNEAKVTRLLIDVQTIAERAEHTADEYARLEAERLSQFKEKWVDYATEYLHRTLPDFADKLDAYSYDYAHRLKENLSQNLFLLSDPLWADYQAETKRTASSPGAPVHVEDLLARLQKKE